QRGPCPEDTDRVVFLRAAGFGLPATTTAAVAAAATAAAVTAAAPVTAAAIATAAAAALGARLRLVDVEGAAVQLAAVEGGDRRLHAVSVDVDKAEALAAAVVVGRNGGAGGPELGEPVLEVRFGGVVGEIPNVESLAHGFLFGPRESRGTGSA